MPVQDCSQQLGSISGYDATGPRPGPDNLSLMVGKRLTLRGLLVGDHAALRPAFEAEVGERLRGGGNTGKAVVRLADAAELATTTPQP